MQNTDGKEETIFSIEKEKMVGKFKRVDLLAQWK